MKKYWWIEIEEVEDVWGFELGMMEVFSEDCKEKVSVYVGEEEEGML